MHKTVETKLKPVSVSLNRMRPECDQLNLAHIARKKYIIYIKKNLKQTSASARNVWGISVSEEELNKGIEEDRADGYEPY